LEYNKREVSLESSQRGVVTQDLLDGETWDVLRGRMIAAPHRQDASYLYGFFLPHPAKWMQFFSFSWQGC
jgi:hypothetical protein